MIKSIFSLLFSLVLTVLLGLRAFEAALGKESFVISMLSVSTGCVFVYLLISFIKEQDR